MFPWALTLALRARIPIFIPPPAPYRTRASTILLIDAQQNIHYIERSHDDGSQPSHVPGTRRFFFTSVDGAAADRPSGKL